MSGVRALAFMLNTLWLLDIDQGRIVLPLTDTVCFRIQCAAMYSLRWPAPALVEQDCL